MKTSNKFKWGLLLFICLCGWGIYEIWDYEKLNLISKVIGTIGMLVLMVSSLLKIDSLSDTDNMIDD